MEKLGYKTRQKLEPEKTGVYAQKPRRKIAFKNFISVVRCNQPNLVETFYDLRTFPVTFDNARGVVNVRERILNHEEFNFTVRSELP